MARIKIQVTVKRMGKFERPAFGYGTETVRVYTMEGEDGKTYVWKTTSVMYFDTKVPNKYGMTDCIPMITGDIVNISATVKGESEYKGEKQTELQRVKVDSIVFKAESYEERQARLAKEREARIKAQRDSLEGDDRIWHCMPYSQYKEHYADCEIIEGSFRRLERSGRGVVDVIIRANRMKASGVRGQHFRGYELCNEKGEHIVYRAVCEDNAIRRANKEHPGHVWECYTSYK